MEEDQFIDHLIQIKEHFRLKGYKTEIVQRFTKFCMKLVINESIEKSALEFRREFGIQIWKRRAEFFYWEYPKKLNSTTNDGSCRFQLQGKHKEALIKIFRYKGNQERDMIKILNEDGRTLTTTNLNIAGITKVNAEHALNLYNDLYAVFDKEILLDELNTKWNLFLTEKDVVRLIMTIRLLLDEMVKGSIHYEYVQHSTYGRLFVNAEIVNFQDCMSEARKLFFHDIGYEYDMEVSHYALMKNKMIVDMKYETFAKDFPTISQYIENKKQIRNTLVIETGLQLSIIKGILTAIAYGAKIQSAHRKDSTFNSNYDFVEKNRPEISREESYNEAKRIFEIVKNNSIVSAMLKESQRMTEIIIDYYKSKSKDPDSIVNDLNQKYELTYTTNKRTFKRTTGQIIANINQTLETKVLLKIVEKYGDKIMLLQHDGFLANAQISTDELENYINAEFNYHLKYSEEKL